MVQPLAHIDQWQFAASHEGVDDDSVFGSIMVAAGEMPTLPVSSASVRLRRIRTLTLHSS